MYVECRGAYTILRSTMAFGQQDRVKYKERLRIMQRSVPNWISMVYLKVFRVFEKYELGVLNMTNFKSVA